MPKPNGSTSTPGRDHAIARALGAWFDGGARDLPWRRQRTPYAVWVSEVMLQQTRVDTVVPFFERFLARFPDARSLADAPLDAVLASWSGLGYYRRARQLHLAAREVVDRFGGAVPSELADLRSLPGIGPYTAGAISSLAYGRRAALVDGNVSRVLARLEAVDAPIKRPATQRTIWSIAERLVPDEGAGRFNEALMELGALVCTPVEPACRVCPLASFCQARLTGRERSLPTTEAKAKVPEVPVVAAVVLSDDGRVLFARRENDRLFGGLWEPPMLEHAASIEAARKGLVALGAPLGRLRLVAAGKVTRLLSHRRMVVTVATARRAKPSASTAKLASPYEAAAWLEPQSLGGSTERQAGISTLAREVLEVGLAALRSRSLAKND